MKEAIDTLKKELLYYYSGRGSGKSAIWLYYANPVTTVDVSDMFMDELNRFFPSIYDYVNMFRQYVKHLRFPTQNEWDYFFMCESIEDKDLQQKIIKFYNHTHMVGKKLNQPCNPNFNKETWKKRRNK